MIDNGHLDRLVSEALVNFDSAKVDWAGYSQLLENLTIAPDSVLAATWCRFGTHNIEALVDAPALTLVHPGGILSSTGKKKTFGKGFKYDEIEFVMCKKWGDTEHTDERGLGKYCIEFAGPGGVLLGRLQWSWRAKRFRDSRTEIMAVAAERDRISTLIGDLIT